MNAGFLAQSLNEVTLSDSAPADQDQVGPAPDEISRGQLFDLQPAEGFGIRVPVEALKRFVLRKVGITTGMQSRLRQPNRTVERFTLD